MRYSHGLGHGDEPRIGRLVPASAVDFRCYFELRETLKGSKSDLAIICVRSKELHDGAEIQPIL
jgi:hypothetical protein